jgi:hypothetical protein
MLLLCLSPTFLTYHSGCLHLLPVGWKAHNCQLEGNHDIMNATSDLNCSLRHTSISKQLDISQAWSQAETICLCILNVAMKKLA